MINRKILKYLENYYKNSQNALLLTGARQTGKTFSIRTFGKSFKHFVEINFVENPDAANTTCRKPLSFTTAASKR